MTKTSLSPLDILRESLVGENTRRKILKDLQPKKLRRSSRWSPLAVIWSLAFLGAALSRVWPSFPRFAF
jgi:hypothetical protein